MTTGRRRSSRTTSHSFASHVVEPPARRSQRRVTRVPSKPVAASSNSIQGRKQDRRRRNTPTAPSFLHRPLAAVEADPNRRTLLFSLPGELIHEIASHLPVESITCLTLTCKEAANVLGIESWSDRSIKQRWAPERTVLLSLLTKDGTGNTDYCARCNTLHPPLLPPRSHRSTRLTTYCFGQDATIDYLPQAGTHGYSLVFLHIQDAMEMGPPAVNDGGSANPRIDALSGDFIVTEGGVQQRIISSARHIEGNLVLSHTRTITSTQGKKPLDASDILDLPVRICPHQSTTTSLATPRSRYVKEHPNSPLLTHAIRACFPETLGGRAHNPSCFNKLAPTEQAQIAAAHKHMIWRCRFCPTKYQLDYVGENELVIRSWHSFGADLYHAHKYWKWFVRREGQLLGPDKRNDEWWSPSRTIPDFIHQ
ncbi:hypothetical protein BX600DRAFT_476477 [Xylariales sp. PMI_506]|nr:hypothetical protein BX600DRAFT_476477 [Xylariales sp. PMI_506]